MPERTNSHSGKSGKVLDFQKSWRPNIKDRTERHYSDIDADKLRLAIDACTRAGGAIMFGVTSDQGAFSVVILSGDQKVKEYPASNTEMTALLDWVAEFFADLLM